MGAERGGRAAEESETIDYLEVHGSAELLRAKEGVVGVLLYP